MLLDHVLDIVQLARGAHAALMSRHQIPRLLLWSLFQETTRFAFPVSYLYITLLEETLSIPMFGTRQPLFVAITHEKHE